MELHCTASTAARVASSDAFASPRPHAIPCRATPGDAAARLATDIFATTLDHIDLGVMVCDADGCLLHANREAQAELARGRLLAVKPQFSERGMAVQAVCGPAAVQALKAAMHGAASRGRRRLVTLHAGDMHLLVAAVPLAGSAGEPLVLLLLGVRQLCSPLGVEMLAALHGLTSAEQRVLVGLANGLNATEIAADAGVALSTLRSQISSVRAKLGARSVDDLLVRLAGVPRMASALQGSSTTWRAAA